MSIDSISSSATPALGALQSFQPVQAAKPVARDSDGDNDNDATESAAAQATELKGPLAANVGRSVDIRA